MAKRKDTTTATEWESQSSSGFPPLWKPQKVGEFVVGVPIEVKSNKYGKQMLHNINFLLRDTNSLSFFSGSKKKKTEKVIKVATGDLVSIPHCYKLTGEKLVTVERGKNITLSPMAQGLSEDSQSMRIVFNGRIALGGKNDMKDFIVQTPKGFTPKTGKKSK